MSVKLCAITVEHSIGKMGVLNGVIPQHWEDEGGKRGDTTVGMRNINDIRYKR